MLVSAAVCPHPPAIVPVVSQGAAGALDEVRRACVAAVRAITDVDHDILVCVGSGSGTTRWGPAAGGSLQDFGADVSFGGAEVVLPPALTVAAYILDLAGISDAAEFQSVARDASPNEAADIGSRLAVEAERVALLVMGDGSAKRSTTSPGYLDARAEAFDADVVRALGEPDIEALLGVDPAVADDLWVAGRCGWQVLAGALGSSAGPMRGTVRYDAAPLGVGYFVVQLTAA